MEQVGPKISLLNQNISPGTIYATHITIWNHNRLPAEQGGEPIISIFKLGWILHISLLNQNISMASMWAAITSLYRTT